MNYIILDQKSDHVLIWDLDEGEARWKNIADIKIGRLRKERKEKLNKLRNE